MKRYVALGHITRAKINDIIWDVLGDNFYKAEVMETLPDDYSDCSPLTVWANIPGQAQVSHLHLVISTHIPISHKAKDKIRAIILAEKETA